MSSQDRFEYGSGELWVEDDESGQSERIGAVPPAAERDRKLRAVEDAVQRLDDRVTRAARARRMDSVLARIYRRKR